MNDCINTKETVLGIVSKNYRYNPCLKSYFKKQLCADLFQKFEDGKIIHCINIELTNFKDIDDLVKSMKNAKFCPSKTLCI